MKESKSVLDFDSFFVQMHPFKYTYLYFNDINNSVTSFDLIFPKNRIVSFISPIALTKIKIL